MKRLTLLFLVLTMVISGSALAAADELKIFIWSEYMDEENMPKEFEKATGIKVRLDLYESNEEMMAKLQAGGVSQYDIIVLDEINIAIWFGLLTIEEVVTLLDTRPAHIELILTGRRAPQEIIDRADLVTDMREVKHYFHDGVQARDGIER